ISRLGTIIAEKHHVEEEQKPKDFYVRVFSLIQEGLQKRSITTNTDMTTSLLALTIDDANIAHYCNAGYCKALLWNKNSLFSLTPTSNPDNQISLPLGMIDPIKLSITKPEIEYSQVRLKRGNSIVLLSPGIIEKNDMPQRIKKILVESKDTKVICHRIMETYQTSLTEAQNPEDTVPTSSFHENIATIIGCIYIN
ncbi:MAG: SpoIIE family protein phosphatase, partial [Caldisericia bacterium]|nr:SpoIIE family protein phosphatase [Caldisericia bacterium]